RSSTYRNRAIPERRDTHQRNGYLHGAKWPAEYDGIGHAHGHAHHNSFGAADRPRAARAATLRAAVPAGLRKRNSRTTGFAVIPRQAARLRLCDIALATGICCCGCRVQRRIKWAEHDIHNRAVLGRFQLPGLKRNKISDKAVESKRYSLASSRVRGPFLFERGAEH